MSRDVASSSMRDSDENKLCKRWTNMTGAMVVVEAASTTNFGRKIK